MRKLLIFLLSVSLTSVIVALSTNSASAHHKEQVLGVATEEKLSIPPTTEGPGFILPDSPLYFIDGIKQKVRLLLAFTPEQKAKVHATVAGERLAELQLMLAKDNIKGIRTALQGMSDNFREASEDLAEAKLSGRDISKLAKSINDSIKEDQETLGTLEKIATGEIKAQVSAAKKSIRVSKVEVEDNLSEDLLNNEIEDDLNDEIEDHIDSATDSARGINRAIDVLTRLASETAKKNQEHREEALLKAIEVKNETLKKQQERLVEVEKKQQEKITEARKKALEKAKQAAKKIDEAIREFQETQQTINEIKNNDSASENLENKEKASESSNSGSGKSENDDSIESEED